MKRPGYDDRVWRALRREVDKLGGTAHVKVGVLAGEGAQLQVSKGFDMGALAGVQEYGDEAAHIPARPFIGSTFIEGDHEIRTFIIDLAKPILSGRIDAVKALELLGAKGAGMVKKKLARGKYLQPRLSPRTIAARTNHSTRPLVDEGHLLNSITSKVVLR